LLSPSMRLGRLNVFGYSRMNLLVMKTHLLVVLIAGTLIPSRRLRFNTLPRGDLCRGELYQNVITGYGIPLAGRHCANRHLGKQDFLTTDNTDGTDNS
jgi:hypothetical protein